MLDAVDDDGARRRDALGHEGQLGLRRLLRRQVGERQVGRADDGGGARHTALREEARRAARHHAVHLVLPPLRGGRDVGAARDVGAVLREVEGAHLGGAVLDEQLGHDAADAAAAMHEQLLASHLRGVSVVVKGWIGVCVSELGAAVRGRKQWRRA